MRKVLVSKTPGARHTNLDLGSRNKSIGTQLIGFGNMFSTEEYYESRAIL